MPNSAEKPNKIQLLPNIDSYLESVDNNVPVSLKGLSNIVDEVSARTKLDKEKSQIIVRLFFQEIRNCLLKNISVSLRRLGRFEIASPKSGTKKRVFTKFKPSENLIKEFNERNKNI